jgi:glucokinase
MTYAANSLSLVADVGGTNTRVALANGAALLTDTVEKVRNAEAESLGALLEHYVRTKDVDCRAAAVAIAGPVHDGKGTLTNLDWSIDEASLARITGAETAVVLNDLQAQAYALGAIAPDHLRNVIQGQPSPPEAARLVIGAGTGFNAALALHAPGGRIVPASECGHISLPVLTDDEFRLSQFLKNLHGFTSVEDVLSGRGVEHIHRWLCQEAGQNARSSTADIMAACEAGDPLALRTVETYVRLMGCVAGDLALVHLPFGGVFLIGGVARAMSVYFDRFGFETAFQSKGRFTDFMTRFPVSVIEDDFAALTGLASRLGDC